MTDETCGAARFFHGVFRKIVEDLFEAYARTPATVSSRPYIERALRLARAGLTESISILETCEKKALKEEEGGRYS